METNKENNFAEETTPAPADYEPIMWDEDDPCRLDFNYYPGVKSLYRKLGALLVAAVVMPALISVIVFGLKIAVWLVLFALLPTGTLIWSCMRAVRSGSCDAIFRTRVTGLWLAVPAMPALVTLILSTLSYGPTILSLIYAALFVAVVYLGASVVLHTHSDRDVRAAFPLESRSQSAGAWRTLFFTIVLPMLWLMMCVVIY